MLEGLEEASIGLGTVLKCFLTFKPPVKAVTHVEPPEVISQLFKLKEVAFDGWVVTKL